MRLRDAYSVWLVIVLVSAPSRVAFGLPPRALCLLLATTKLKICERYIRKRHPLGMEGPIPKNPKCVWSF